MQIMITIQSIASSISFHFHNKLRSRCYYDPYFTERLCELPTITEGMVCKVCKWSKSEFRALKPGNILHTAHCFPMAQMRVQFS